MVAINKRNSYSYFYSLSRDFFFKERYIKFHGVETQNVVSYFVKAFILHMAYLLFETGVIE